MSDQTDPPADWTALDRRAFRDALGNFLTGVTVVTTIDQEGRLRGFTANSFTSVSLDPPLILVCPAKSAASYEVFQSCQSFAVNVLGEGQKEASNTFASKRPDKFETVGHRVAATGAPILDGCLSWFDCLPHERVDAGDHMVLIGRVQAFDASGGLPLAYLRGGYAPFQLESQAALASEDPAAHVGCIVDWQGRVLLRHGPDGSWNVPLAQISGPGHHGSIEAVLAKLKISADVTFLYSVFEVKGQKDHYIVYRGELEGPPEGLDQSVGEMRFFGPDDLPWPDLPAQEFKTLLKRYFKERSLARFGVYADLGIEARHAQIGGEPRPWDEEMA